MLEDIRNAAYEISEQRLKDREERLVAREEKELTFGPVDEMLSDVADNLGTETESKNEQEYGID